MQFMTHLYRNRLFFILILILLGALLTGCAGAPKRNPLPQDFAGMAEIPGYPLVRYWGDAFSKLDEEIYTLTDEEFRNSYAGVIGREHTYLILSGGGPDGAFGAGLLVGWSAAGTRPEFTQVTGISTGALMAPFAFLGPAYDEMLKEFYTTLSAKDLITERGLFALINGDAAAGTEPLQTLIARYIDQKVIDAIAAEHQLGRRLFIGTTDLDSGRPMHWDIGRIAASSNPKRMELIHKVVLASASIPGLFPPVIIDVEYEGRRYDEMHVDGGAANQVLLYPYEVDWEIYIKRFAVRGRPNTYVIRNSRLYPSRKAVERRLLPIVGRSVSSLIRSQAFGDLYQAAIIAKRDGLNLYLAHIPDTFEQETKEMFDPVYMSKLFDLGYNLARKGNPWIDVLEELESFGRE